VTNSSAGITWEARRKPIAAVTEWKPSVEAKFALGALFISLVAVIVDVKSARIPNWLTGGGLLVGLGLHVCFAGWSGLEMAAAAALAGGGVLFLPFLVGGIGGGDVKLMAAASAWVGIHHALALIFATAIAGGVFAIGYIAFRRRTSDTLSRVWQLCRFHLLFGIRPHPDVSEPLADSIHFPYSLAVAAGTVFVLVSISMPAWG
jgi:prepilin peptidase CpaA